jgi:hypothetical protein
MRLMPKPPRRSNRTGSKSSPYTTCSRWGHSESLLDPHEVVIREMKGDRSFEILHFFREGIR